MKKRILSFLLVLCMLLTAMPIFTFGSGASETAVEDENNELTKNEDSKAVSSFYDYYVTDGLVAFFDAYDTKSTTLDLENGKWYAKVYNASTKGFEKSTDEGLVATIGGGVLGSTTEPAEEGAEPIVNTTGWVKGDKGFSYFTNQSVGANKISLPLALIASDSYTVEFVGSVKLREIHDAEQETGTVEKTVADGKATYTISGLTLLTRNNGTTDYTNLCYYTVTLKGEANATVDLTINGSAVSVKLDGEGNGSYMAKCTAKLDTYVIVAPENVELTFTKDKTLNGQYMSTSAFVFGTLHCTHWTNLIGDNAWGNGAGKTRWYTGSSDWGVHNGTAGSTQYGGALKDTSFFVNYNDQAAVLRVQKSKLDAGESYTVSYGTSSTSVSGDKPFANYKFDLLSNTCGTAYAVRVYNRHLTADEKKLNDFADKMILNDVDFGAFNALEDRLKEMYIKSTEALTLDAGNEEFTKALDGVLDYAEKEAAMRAMTDYDKLYAGADGNPTANGGSLVALFSAYGDNSASLDLVNKSWRDKVGMNDIVFQGAMYDEATGKGYWKLRQDGGVGYDMNFDTTGKNGTYNSGSGVYMQLEPSLIASPDFTVEYVVAYEYFTYLDGSVCPVNLKLTYNESPAETIGLLKNFVSRTGPIDATGASRGTRWYVAKPSTGWQQSGFNHQLWGDVRPDDDIYLQSITRDESDITGGKQAVYEINKNGSMVLKGTYKSNAAQAGEIYYIGSDAAGQSFQLFRQIPVSAYSIRVYDAVLTSTEMQHNRFVDLAAYCGADMTAYMALSKEAQTIVDSMLAGNGFDLDTEAFEAALKTVTDILGNDSGLADSLYVTDGLTMLLAAYSGFNTGAIGGNGAPISWFNGVQQGSFATLRGSGWTLNEDGGFTIVKTWEEFQKDITFGLYLDQSLLPTGGYTVELVANPVGVTNPDGTRFIDDFSTYGQNYNNGFAIGPMRCLQFVCMRPTGKDGQLEKRWVYQKETNAWHASGYKARWTDTTWKTIGLDQILTYTISMTLEEDLTSNYIFSQDSVRKGSIQIPAAQYINPMDTDRQFQLMVGVAGTIYACRVYNRPLTDSEVKQNHMADLVYFYEIDTTFLDSTLSSMSDASALYDAFADMDFTLSKEDAQEYFESKTAAIWLTYSGFGVRKDLTDGVRFYFDLNQDGIDAMLTAGFGLEIGTIVNVGKDALPVLDDYGYDYKVLAFDSIAGKYTSFFTDDTTYAVTVRYENADKQALLASLGVRGYVKLISPDGSEMVFYAEVATDAPTNHFEAFYSVKENDNPALADDMELESYVTDRIEYCYDDVYVHVDANAQGEGDGTAEAPFASFNDGWEKAKELMLSLTKPTYLYLQTADGVYGLYGTLSLSAEEKPYAYCNFIIISENGNSILTTNIDINSGDFVYEGDNIYTYQFEPNADGEYPEFRYLYVNDRMANLSVSSATRAVDVDGIYRTAVEREFDAVYYNAQMLSEYDGLLTVDFMPESYVGRSDLETSFAYYAAYFVALKDVEKLFNEKQLTEMTIPDQSKVALNGVYSAAFEYYKQAYLAYGVLQPVAVIEGPTSDAFAAMKAPTDANATYRTWFAKIQTFMIDNKTYNYTFTVDQTTDMKTIGKVYLDMEMVGDLSHMVEEGRERMLAYAEQLQLEIDAALEEAKALSEYANAEVSYAIELCNYFASITQKYLDEKMEGVYKAAKEAYMSAEADLNAALKAYLAAEEAYAIAEAAYEAALAAFEAAEESEKEALAADLAEKLAAYENAAIALEETNATGEAAAETYSTAFANYVKVGMAYEAATALDEEDNPLGMDGIKALLEATNEVRAEAETAALQATSNLASVQKDYDEKSKYISEIKDEDLWVRHALTQYMIEMHVAAQWDYNIIHITGIDYNDIFDYEYLGEQTTQVAVYLEMSEYSRFNIPANYTFVGRYVFLKNILEYVDAENEYFYDEEIGKLYYYTEEDINDLKFAYPTSDYMFKFYDLKNVTIEGMQFTGVDDNFLSDNGHCGGQSASDSRFGGFPERSAIYIKGCYGMEIVYNQFYDLGVEGITCRGWIQDLTIEGNTFENIGAAAIRVGDNTADWTPGVAGNLRVSIIDNYVNNAATEYHQSSTIQIQSNKDCVIQNNTVMNTSYTAFSLGWRWSTVSWQRGDAINQDNMDISGNYITHFMTELADGGAIYMLGGNADISDTSYFNFIYENYILFSNISGNGLGGMICGIYFDGSCTNWHCYSNVVVEQSYGAHTSENDHDYSDVYVEQLRKRRNGSTFIYIQHISSQLTYNILVENNIIINVRSKDDDQALKEVYKTYVVASRNIKESGTRYIRDIDRIPSMAENIMYAAGAFDYPGDPSELYGNDY